MRRGLAMENIERQTVVAAFTNSEHMECSHRDRRNQQVAALKAHVHPFARGDTELVDDSRVQLRHDQ